MIVLPDTVQRPTAVVIKASHTTVAQKTVPCTQWLHARDDPSITHILAYLESTAVMANAINKQHVWIRDVQFRMFSWCVQ